MKADSSDFLADQRGGGARLIVYLFFPKVSSYFYVISSKATFLMAPAVLNAFFFDILYEMFCQL